LGESTASVRGRQFWWETLVMRDSREEEAYAVADQKLRMITKALVPHDRFDALFSRVMTLIPPEELQEALLRRREDGSGIDVEKIGQLDAVMGPAASDR
jgi:hypothetical protein